MGEKRFEPVQRRSLRETVLKTIRQAIMRGDLKPGDPLREVHIAEQMGISRAPIREAIRDLESEGLVVSHTYRGAFVAQLSDTDLWEIYTLRAALERMAVEIVAQSASPELLETLRHSVADMTQAAAAGDIERLVALDIAFHETLCRHANHTRLFDTWSSMISQIRIFMDLTHMLYLPAEEMIQMHVELIEQIANQETQAAGQILARHILEAGEFISREHVASQEEKMGQA